MELSYRCENDYPVIATSAGKIRGYQYGTVFAFLGVPYGKAARYRMPERPDSWTGVRDTLNYGYVCPLTERPVPETEMLLTVRNGMENENCLNLNVWTSTLEQSAKKPVMVWLHGGGFNTGSSMEFPAYEGRNLAEQGDVVVVSLNHRLNILGFLDLSSYGEQYRNSGNLGLADIVLALHWVQENITNFGGNPDNVTIFGQSGGGAKAQAMGQIKEAEGLFSKLIIMSGVVDVDFGMRNDRLIAETMLELLGRNRNDASAFDELPYYELSAAFRKTRRLLADRHIQFFHAPIQNDYYRGEPLRVGFGSYMDHVPVMVGTTISEVEPTAVSVLAQAGATKEKKEERIRNRYGENAKELICLFQKAYPDKDILHLLAMDILMREPTLRLLQMRQSAEAATYNYMFAADFLYKGGTSAWHSGDIPFAFRNTSIYPVSAIYGSKSRLEDRFSSAFTAFAHTGSPATSKLPQWLPYTDEHRVTMIFDKHCRAAEAYDEKLIHLLGNSFVPFRSDQDYRDE